MVWIMPMGYEVDKQILELYVEHMLSKLVDPNEERFWTYKEKILKISSVVQESDDSKEGLERGWGSCREHEDN